MPPLDDETVDNPVTPPAGDPPADPAVVTPPADPAPVTPPDPAVVDPAKAADPAPVDPDKPADPAPVTPPADKPDDAPKALSVEDVIKAMPADQQDKAREYAKRRGFDATEIFRSSMAADSKISELTDTLKGMVKVPGKDAKKEDIEAFDKARGVPDKADDYKLPTDEASPFDPVVNPIIRQMAKEAGYTQAQLDQGMGMIDKILEVTNAEAAVAVKKFGENSQDALRIDWGVKEYQPNLNLIDRYINQGPMAQYMTKEERESLMNFRDPSTYGARGESVGFAKYLLAQARMWADDPLTGDGPSNGVDVSVRKAEIYALMHTDEEKYKSPAIQDELRKLIRIENARKATA